MEEITAGSIKKFWKKIGKKINYISDAIDKNKGTDFTNFYQSIDNIADEIRKKIIKTEAINCERMPVEINNMAKSLGIDVANLTLTYKYSSGRRRITQLRMQENPIIFVDSEASEAEVRYAIAFEIGHFMSWYWNETEGNQQASNKSTKHAYTLIPMISHSSIELVADALAISLLVPFNNFCEEFYQYMIENNKKERFIRTEEWLEYLAERAGISFVNMAIGYQQLRYIALIEDKRNGVLDSEKWKKIRPDHSIGEF